MWSAAPEELEANYSILRLTQLLGTEANGDLIYQVVPARGTASLGSRNLFWRCRMRALPDSLICGFAIS